MKRFIIQFIIFVCFILRSYAGDLIDCPDCGSPVSERAIMCPQCGCPASGILEAVELKHAAEKLQEPRFVVRVNADNTSGYAIVVAEDSKFYAIMDASLMDATESLSITLLATNKTVRYQQFQAANSSPLVRFVIKSTNVISVTIIEDIIPKVAKENYLWLTPDIYSDCIYTGKVTISDSLEVPDIGIELIALADSRTNIAALVCNDGGRRSLSMARGTSDWITVQLGDYRRQTKLLVEAEKMVKNGALPDDMSGALVNNKWATEFLKKRAKRLLKRYVD